MMNIDECEFYFLERTQELRNICKDGTVWVFLCASALIEYLSKLVNGQDIKRKGYIQFIEDYMAKIRREYITFKYDNGNNDVPIQMYHILRCGIVHSFSFIPDQQTMRQGGRRRSIVLNHRRSGQTHLSPYKSEKAPDAVNFVAEDFIEDIQKTIVLVFSIAKSDNKLKENIKNWLDKHPPIMANI